MQLRPRYGADPLIRLDGDPSVVLEPTVRQRRRLLDALTSFGTDDWNHASRCVGWSARDVIVHLDSTNAFWTFSIGAGLAGTPSTFLATFDPVRSPAELVAASATVSSAEVLERFAASTDAFVTLLESLGPADWERLAEAPPGHVRVTEVVHHALWDSWIHERDVLLPLGLQPPVEADEAAACLRYGAALGPAVAVNEGPTPSGALGIDATDPDLAFTVHLGERVSVTAGLEQPDLVVAGDAATLVDALTFRTPLTQEIDDGDRWLLGGLAAVFDREDP